MPHFCEARETYYICTLKIYLLKRNFYGFIFTETTVAKNPDIKYWKYRDFDLNFSGDGDALAQTQYMKKDIPQQ